MASKTRKFRVDPLSKANSDINVTPLVDVVLVLLIIFMVVTPLMEKDIQVRVPPSEVSDVQTPPDQSQVVVTLSAAGAIAINNQPLGSVQEYIQKLTNIMNAKSKADRVAFFMPEDNANYGKLIELLDGAKAAKVDILGMVTELPAGAGGGAAPAPAPTP